MAEAPFAERLHHESERWVADGVVTAEQAAALRERYPLGEAPRSRAATTLAAIGGVTVGVGVLGLVAANWEEMSHGLRLALLVVAIAGAYAGGYRLRETGGPYPRVGEALYVVGVLAYGASLFLVGQMYHVEAHDPLALLLWAAGAAAAGAAVRSRWLEVVALLIFTGWVAWEAGLALSRGTAWAAFPVLAIGYGAVLYGLGTVAGERGWARESAYPRAARRLGLPLAAAGLFVFTFRAIADDLEGAGGDLGGGIVAAFAALTVLALASAAGLALLRRRSATVEAAGLAVAVVVMLAAVLVGGNGTAWTIVFNVLFAALALGTISAGYLSDEGWLVNLGLVLVGADLVARYFDVFWSALGRSLGVTGAGLLILVLAWALERQRRRVLERMSR